MADNLTTTNLSRRGRTRKPPATQAERDALIWPAIDAKFDWPNDEWALRYLPQVRIATLILQRDHNELKELMADFVKGGVARRFSDQAKAT